MGTTVFFTRGFTVPRAQYNELINPLAVSNLYGKGGRFHEGDEEGVSFSIQVAEGGMDASKIKQDARSIAEHYAKMRTSNKEGYVPVVVTFNLTEETFHVLQGKLGVPRKLKIGGTEMVEVSPIETFGELKTHHDGEVVVQARSLTKEQLKQLDIVVGTADVGKEGQRVSFSEAISSKAEFSYRPFEGNSPSLGEGWG